MTHRTNITALDASMSLDEAVIYSHGRPAIRVSLYFEKDITMISSESLHMRMLWALQRKKRDEGRI